MPVFSDVNDGYRFYKQIGELKYQGIVNGFSDESLRPDDPILRQQLAKMLVLAQLRLADENYSKVQGHSTQTPTYSYPLGYLKTAAAAVYLPWNEALGAGALSTITRLELAMALAPIGDGILEPPPSTYRLPFLDVPASAAKDVALLDFNVHGTESAKEG
ncbi:MAG: S-layer homology domain-containing protein [bacterium]